MKGNLIVLCSFLFQSDSLAPQDVLINEILSNPKPGGVEFIELYNYSNKAVDLQQLEIASVNANGVTGSRRSIASHPILLLPNEYKVLTPDPEALKKHYPNGMSETFMETPNLPNFNNERGGVVLYAGGVTIDSLFYTPDMRSPFLADPKGISLERQHFAIETNMRGNFQSAATSVGGATPGYQNSAAVSEAETKGITLSSPTFSPDGDGYEDLLEINYHFSESGWIATIDIYNDNGRLVKKLLRNQSLATEGQVTWDGLSDANERLSIGLYIAVIELYSVHGSRKIYRKPFTLAARL